MNAIEVLRKRAGLTQSELAEILCVSQANISQWESGESLPRAEKLPEVAKVLSCSIDALFQQNK